MEWWLLAFHFPDGAAAEKAYVASTNVLRQPNPLDASVYRLQLNGQWVVATIGAGSLEPEYRASFQRAGRTGIPVGLPDAVADSLLERSLRTWLQKPGFIERRGINEVVE